VQRYFSPHYCSGFIADWGFGFLPNDANINCKERLGLKWETFMSATPFEEGLALLRAHYAERIDMAVAAGRMDLVRELADNYEDEALELMLSVEGGAPAQPGHGTVEILEFGPSWRRRPASSSWRFAFWRHKKR
jgi:hypothetical protein